MQRTTLAAVIAGLFVLPVQAQEIFTLDEIVVSATRISTPDVLAPYASEVHSRRMIDQSGAASLYDYLSHHSSVNVLPSSGNRYTPKLDMRGYGIGDGYQNIVISLDGRRLNNIDMSSQLLGGIPLADIERIEITKGSGSVLFGDGATAGSIQIYTRQHEGVTARASAGNHGALAATLTAGIRKEKLSLDISADHSSQDGTSDTDPSGHRDASSNRTWRGGIEGRPLAGVKLKLDGGGNRIDTRYVSLLTLAQFNANPAQPGSNPWVTPANSYNRQRLESDHWGLGAEITFARDWLLTVDHSREAKLSDFISASYKSDYDYQINDLGLRYQGEAFSLAAGVRDFDGTRVGSGNRTGKANTGWYAQGQYTAGDLTLSAGARREQVRYSHEPAGGATLASEHRLAAWDLGMNWRLDQRLSLFSNFNRAFQAPDIDRFFATDFSVFPAVTSFNGFISPTISRTLNLGLNHITAMNRLKLTLFRVNLDNEIYYYSSGPWTGYNTNFDKSHKYGLEIQDHWRINDRLAASINYAYTRAIIDHENDGGGAYDGKDLPGVPRHGVTLGLSWQATQAAHLQISHTWRASAYAADDFANTFAQKQAAYQSTDIAMRYRVKDIEWLAAVDNLFAHKNGMWITNDAIYPVDFTRNWRLGMKATF